jgi:hypothetical protein
MNDAFVQLGATKASFIAPQACFEVPRWGAGESGGWWVGAQLACTNLRWRVAVWRIFSFKDGWGSGVGGPVGRAAVSGMGPFAIA